VQQFSEAVPMLNERPWLRFYGNVPHSIDYPETTLYEAIASAAARVPDAIAWDFLDTTSSYRDFLAEIDRFANALAALGLQRHRGSSHSMQPINSVPCRR
jgi:long-chain acyl-CoA synthetase